MALVPHEPAVIPDDDPENDLENDLERTQLARVRDVARQERPEGWVGLSATIKQRVREVVVPAYPILVRELPDGSRTYVSTRVVRAALRMLLRREASHVPTDLRLHLDGARLVGVDVALVAAYGVDLLALAARVRRDVVAEVTALTGVDLLAPADIGIDMVDVVEGDPRVV